MDTAIIAAIIGAAAAVLAAILGVIISKKREHLSIVDIIVNPGEYNPTIEFKLRNKSDYVIFIKKAELETLGQWDILEPFGPMAVPVNASYDVKIKPDPGSITNLNISQEVKSNSVDRFEFVIASEHEPDPFIGILAYLIKIRLIYNENNKSVETPPILLDIPRNMDIIMAAENPLTRELVQNNKKTSELILRKITDDTVYDHDVYNQIKEWASLDPNDFSKNY